MSAAQLWGFTTEQDVGQLRGQSLNRSMGLLEEGWSRAVLICAAPSFWFSCCSPAHILAEQTFISSIHLNRAN